MAQKRYDQLIDLVEQAKPATILEIGVWNGVRAMQMAAAALKHSPKVHYQGFDLFEEASDQTDADEFNKKKHNTIEAVRGRLAAFGNENPGFSFELHKGNTRETLSGVEHVVDFAYIDGGHSVETIWSDYCAVRDSKVVVFDDYYRSNAAGECPDLTKFGANEIIDLIDGAVVLDSEDAVAGGGTVHIAVVGM